ncbi:MAG: hypothetical protein B7Y25_02535 [Alphaproteobacteria bacterium 16-39-46]|nr:MAG: hypothetical protein B7Y25_02535 [Alphaproteobacteria bacterium 16-39-46]OZA43629.1 MAG: hypothetical protein B7X84_02650 [Alphaproteobacteria bacterium 17-39-52]HQS83790.1 hypothetical protein [Alphaproteobacteria bacterium]HQS93613.1 hypothetical protein [Alphaproteobacteria bacterium]
MNALQKVKSHLNPGCVYRRSDLKKWSNAVDRHLDQLQKEKMLLKLSGGVYYYPKETVFGQVPPEDYLLIKAFLKDTRFLITTPNMYNSLGVVTTQLYNSTIVYNFKRHGLFKLGGRIFNFVRKPHFPLKLSSEFLLVDLVDNVQKLSENKERIFELVKKKALSMDQKSLYKAIKNYGGIKAKNFFANIFNDESLTSSSL